MGGRCLPASRGWLGNQLANGQHSGGTAVSLGQDRRFLLHPLGVGMLHARHGIRVPNPLASGLGCSLLGGTGSVGSLTTGSPRGRYSGPRVLVHLACVALWYWFWGSLYWLNVQSGQRKPSPSCWCSRELHRANGWVFASVAPLGRGPLKRWLGRQGWLVHLPLRGNSPVRDLWGTALGLVLSPGIRRWGATSPGCAAVS